jgi:hypothetical protein
MRELLGDDENGTSFEFNGVAVPIPWKRSKASVSIGLGHDTRSDAGLLTRVAGSTSL